MFKKIKRIVLIVNIAQTVMFVVGFILILSEAGIIDVGATSSDSNSNLNLTVTAPEIQEVLAKTDVEVWNALTGGLLSARPDDKAPANADAIEAAVRSQIVDITVPIRTWENPSDDSNLNMKDSEATLEVNKFLEKFWIGFFNDIYKNCPKFAIVDVGCFRIDGLGYGQIGFKSAHTYGAAVDINPYEDGNPYGSEGPYSKSEWEALPENHLKYQIIYKDSPMVQIAQAYTLNWGGSWTHGTYDIMHFSFVCDGKTRAEWQQSSGT